MSGIIKTITPLNPVFSNKKINYSLVFYIIVYVKGGFAS